MRLRLLALLTLTLLCWPAANAPAQTGKDPWLTSQRAAMLAAKRTGKPVLAYFCGSDWEDYTRELDDLVMNTRYFQNWARENVILLKVDFPSDKSKISKLLEKQNKDLAEQYMVTKIPVALFLDHDGIVIGRAMYEQMKLRKGEKKGIPAQWVQLADDIVKGKGPQEKVSVALDGLDAGVKFSKETGLPLLILLYDPDIKIYGEHVNQILGNTQIARFINTSMAAAKVTWPAVSDDSAEGKATRKWLDDHKLLKTQLLIAVWDPAKDEIVYRSSKSVNTVQPQGFLTALEKSLPEIEYKGEWIDDYRKARAIAAQSRRSMVIAFTSLDSSPYCRQLDVEIFTTETFRDYARYNLVLLRIDFPKKQKLDENELKKRNELADAFGVKGYPTVVVLNAAGQKIATSGYIKGGPDPFVGQLREVRRKDMDRHDHPSQW